MVWLATAVVGNCTMHYGGIDAVAFSQKPERRRKDEIDPRDEQSCWGVLGIFRFRPNC